MQNRVNLPSGQTIYKMVFGDFKMDPSQPIIKENMKKLPFLFAVMLFMALSISIFAQSPIRVVCIGNSITAGYGNTTQAKAWPGQLNILLGSRYTFLNCASSGTRMSKTVGPSFWNDGNFTNAMNSNPQILIISLGTNDGDQNLWSQIKPTFKKDYIAMIDTFRTKGRNPIIYTCLPPPVFANPYQTANIKNELIPIIREISALKGTYIIDYHNTLLTSGSLFPDGVHPNDDGAIKMANIAYPVIYNNQLIMPYVCINGADSVETISSIVKVGDELTFKPLPKDGGTWSWTGPSGFTATSRLVTLSNIQLNKGGVYTSIYTNTTGWRSIQNYMVTIAGCTAATIIPYINAGSWSSTTFATVNPGSSISFGPQPNDGTWFWTGPNGFFANSREFTVSNIVKSQAGIYTANYYNATGCKTTKDFTITVDGAVVCPTLTSNVSANGGPWQTVTKVSLKSGGSFKFGPGPSDGAWSWTGPSGFSSNSRETSVNNIQINQAGQYIGTFTTVAGCIKTLIITITVDGISAVETPNDDDNSGVKSYPNPVNDMLTLTNVPADTSITVFNLYGQSLLSTKSSHNKGNININVREIKAGSYLVKIGNSGEIKTLKLLKI